MIAVDTNLLVYAHREDTEDHVVALTLLTELACGQERWAIPWPCAHEFIAIVTHPQIFKPPTPIEVAFAALEAWARSPRFQFIGEGHGYLETLRETATNGRATGPRIHDARVAAICLCHGVRELWSADRDFSRFSRLRTVNPLSAASRRRLRGHTRE